MNKKTITINSAIAELFANANKNFDMRFEEFLHSLFYESVLNIQEKCVVEGFKADGLDDEDVAWYDDLYDGEFKENILMLIKEKFDI